MWAALLLVTYWWATGASLTGAGAGGASTVAELGRLAGLLASVLLLVQVLATARVPVLEQAFGQHRLIVLHRRVGVVSFSLMIAHVVLASWARAPSGLAAAPQTLWHLTWNERGMVAGTGGTLLLVLVVMSSVGPVRARLRYERWHLLHLYAYLGVGLALPHQLWTGREFTSSPARTVFWWGLWGAALTAVVVWRIGLPVARTLRHRIVVAAVLPEGDGSVSVHMTGRRLDALGAAAGQFLIWRFRAGRGWTRGHPYSLSAAPDGRSLRITVKELGDGSAAVPNLRQGTRVLIEGPYGRLTGRARTSPRVALIGAGVGMTPIRALTEQFLDESADVVVLHRFSREPLFAREFTRLARERGVELITSPGPRRGSDSWLGRDAGQVDDVTALRARIPDIAVRETYICGPVVWTTLVRRSLVAAGVPQRRIHVENFG